MMRHVLRFVLAAAALAAAAPLAAQDPVPPQPPAPPVRDTMPPVDTIATERPSPRAAFVRAMIVPGWGHFGVGEYRRGTVYAALQGTSWAMLGVTLNRLADARDRDRIATAIARDSLLLLMEEDEEAAQRLADPITFEAALLQHPAVADTRPLRLARERHRQDWIVYTIVLTFAGAIDAYVTAHLRDFPAEVTTAPARDGGTAVGLRVPVGSRR
jgi:hypothetical protein